MAEEIRQSDKQQHDTAQMRVCPVCKTAIPSSDSQCINGHRLSDRQFTTGALIAGSYEYRRVIASGASATVYEARHCVLGKSVAIKLLHPQAITEEVIMRFQQEGWAASNLNHRNLVCVHDMGTTDNGQLYMVMDYVDGRSLEDIILQDGPLSPEAAIDMFIQLCDALGYAHEKGILYRDVKPANILCSGVLESGTEPSRGAVDGLPISDS